MSPAAPTASVSMRCAEHRPFTPDLGRARRGPGVPALGAPGAGARLAYAHAAGLVMRHDKEAFAGQSMAAAKIGKLIGDDVRILVFSAYVEALAAGGADRAAIHRLLDPFTGCFASATPQTVVLLRLALRTLRLFGSGKTDDAREYAIDGTGRVLEALTTHGDPGFVATELERERTAWDHYYDGAGAAGGRPRRAARPRLRGDR